MSSRGAVNNTAKARAEALAEAEARLVRPKAEANRQLRLSPAQIKFRLALFQPREFSYGARDVDAEHVKKLKRAVETTEGNLDPVLVIKLGREWVCVDGHHRLAAYEASIGDKVAVPCEWFDGTVREAVDEGMCRNNKDKLNVVQQDRMEEAWKRVLLKWGSKKEIRILCNVGEGTVAQMRRVAKQAVANDAAGKLFRERLEPGGMTPAQARRKLMETTWSITKLAHLGIGGKEITEETRAARLARRINARLTNTLSRDPAVTARALQLYDPELPEKLMAAWGKPAPAWLATTADVDPYSDVGADTVLDDKDL